MVATLISIDARYKSRLYRHAAIQKWKQKRSKLLPLRGQGLGKKNTKKENKQFIRWKAKCRRINAINAIQKGWMGCLFICRSEGFGLFEMEIQYGATLGHREQAWMQVQESRMQLFEMILFLNWIWFTPKKLEEYLRDQGFKGNPYRLFVGDQYDSGKLIKQAVKTNGKQSYMWVGRKPRVFVTEPELVESLEGDTWSKRRQLITTTFQFEKLKLMLPAFYLSCRDMVSKWEKLPEGGSTEIDVWHDLETLT